MNDSRHANHYAAPGDRRFVAPWQPTFERFITPFEQFIHHQTTSGILLMICAVVALLLANSPLAAAYLHLIHTPIAIHFGEQALDKSLQHWINDGLMAMFFFVVGLEIKREVLVGELARPRQAALPIIAALGGMLVPALLYYLLNPAGRGTRLGRANGH